MAVVEGLLTIKTVKTFWDMAVSLLDQSAKFREADVATRSRAILLKLLIAWREPLRRYRKANIHMESVPR